MLEIEQPGLYRHPSPFATNPFWEEEITLGPGPPPRRAKKKAKDSLKRGTTSASMESARGSTSNSDGETDDLDKSMHGDRRHSLNPKHWNFRRYQREDEALWGQSFDRESGATGTHASGRDLSRSNTDPKYSRTETMYIARNPPVNDLHPPVVSTPSSNLNETRWMLQPPPPAKVMSGKERANNNRSRSSTTASRSCSQVKLSSPKGTDPSEELNNITDETRTQKALGDDLNNITPTRTTSSSGNRARRRPEPISITPTLPNCSSPTVIQTIPLKAADAQVDVADFANNAPPHAIPKRISTTKRLSTIVSSESDHLTTTTTANAPTATSKENAPSSSSETIASTSAGSASSSSSLGAGAASRQGDELSRTPLVVSDSSLQILEELVSPAALLHSRFVKAPAVEARIELPAASSVEELHLEREKVEELGQGRKGGGGDDEGLRFYDSWGRETKRKDSGMVEMPRDVRARWSMDI